MLISLASITPGSTEARKMYDQLKLCSVHADGNCLYAATQVGLQVIGTQSPPTVQDMRIKVRDYLMRQYRLQPLLFPENFREELDSIKDLDSWNNDIGDFVMYALGEIYDLRFEIYQTNIDHERIDNFLTYGKPESVNIIRLVHYIGDASHYNVLVPTSMECSSLTGYITAKQRGKVSKLIKKLPIVSINIPKQPLPKPKPSVPKIKITSTLPVQKPIQPVANVQPAPTTQPILVPDQHVTSQQVVQQLVPSITPDVTMLETSCNLTRTQLVRLMVNKGCSDIDMNRIDTTYLCELYKYYQSLTTKNALTARDTIQLQRDLDFIGNATYIKYALETLPLCPDVSYTNEAIVKLIQQSINPELVDSSQTQTQLQCYLRELMSQCTNYNKDNLIRSSVASGLPLLLNCIKQVLHVDFKQEEGKGVQGVVFKAKLFNGGQTVALIKSSQKPNDPASFGELMHELAVGYAINTLRSLTKSWFTFTYGGFFCGMRYDQATKTVSQLCNVNNYSNIDPKSQPDNTTLLTLQQYIPTEEATSTIAAVIKQDKQNYGLSTQTTTMLQFSKKVMYNFNSIMLQLAQALNTAQQKLMFMHYDLHYNNVLIRATNVTSTTTIKVNNFEHQLPTLSYVPTIIDYGMAVCKVVVPTTEGGTQDVYLWNRYRFQRNNVLEKQIIVSLGNGLHQDHFFLPFYDMYRYVTTALNALTAYLLDERLMKSQADVVNVSVNRASVEKSFRYASVLYTLDYMYMAWFSYLKSRAKYAITSKLKHWLNMIRATPQDLDLNNFSDGVRGKIEYYKSVREMFQKYEDPIQTCSAEEGIWGFFSVNPCEKITTDVSITYKPYNDAPYPSIEAWLNSWQDVCKRLDQLKTNQTKVKPLVPLMPRMK